MNKRECQKLAWLNIWVDSAPEGLNFVSCPHAQPTGVRAVPAPITDALSLSNGVFQSLVPLSFSPGGTLPPLLKNVKAQMACSMKYKAIGEPKSIFFMALWCLLLLVVRFLDVLPALCPQLSHSSSPLRTALMIILFGYLHKCDTLRIWAWCLWFQFVLFGG